MRRPMLNGFSVVLALGVLAFGAAYAKEPGDTDRAAIALVVEIGDQKIEAELGHPFHVQIEGKTVRMRVTAKPTRTFNHAGVSFEYPRDMDFEFNNRTAGAKVWSLDGNDVVLMVQHFASVPTGKGAALLAKGAARRFGSLVTQTSKTQMSLGGHELKGVRLDASVSGARIALQFFDLPSKEGAVVLVLQDSLADDGNHSQEFEAIVPVLSKTLQVK